MCYVVFVHVVWPNPGTMRTECWTRTTDTVSHVEYILGRCWGGVTRAPGFRICGRSGQASSEIEAPECAVVLVQVL